MRKPLARTVQALYTMALLLSLALGGGARAWAQLVGEPLSVSVAVAQGETTTRTVTLTNAGDAPLTFCITFDRPLQRVGGQARLVGSSAPCGGYGEVLYRYDDEDFGSAWSPYSITMTPDGRLFVAESSGFPWRTFEFAPELQLIRFFEHPHVAELTPFSATQGIGFDHEGGSGEGTLWWMNIERSGGSNGQTRRILLLEGDLDGEATGRQVEIVPPDEPLDDFYAGGLAYDPATESFYFLGISGYRQESDVLRLWAVNRAGVVPEGYPHRPEPYPDGLLGVPDAHGGAEGGPGGTPGSEGVRVEYGVYPAFGPGRDRIVVVDRWGGGQGEALETPVPPELFAAGGGGINGNPLRSRTDPNGVMYMAFTNFENTGIVGVRPHPLPPSWLVVDSDAGPEAAWDGTLGPGESREVSLTFRAGARAVGSYTSALQAFDAETGEAVVVPLSLAVTQGTDAEDEAAALEAVKLTVHPNPTAGRATVTLVLPKAAEVRTVVYDVLGREVTVLHNGRLPAGLHRLVFDGSGLPGGVHVVRTMGAGFSVTQPVTILR